MPITDWDGTANSTISKMCDWDGSANHQIGKVHDYDGTTSHLIYSADMPLFTSGVGQNVPWYAAVSYSSHGEYSNSATQLYAKVHSNSTAEEQNRRVMWRTSSKVDVTGFSTLRLKFSELYTEWGSCNYIVGGLSSTGTYHDLPYNPSSFSEFSTTGLVAGTYWVKHQTTLKNQTWDIDISGINGSYYVQIIAAKRYGEARSAYFKLTDAILL